MKIKFTVLVLSLILSFASRGYAADSDSNPAESVVVQKEYGLIDWTKNFIEANGMAVAPEGVKGARAKALARRGAVVDLQRNLLEFIVGVQVDARTSMTDFMTSDRVRSEINGMIRNVELLEGEWDGEAYSVIGRVRLPELLVIAAPEIKAKTPAPKQAASTPPRTAGRYTGLVIDARHLPIVPSLAFHVVDESGREVYGINFASPEFAAKSGLATYYNNIEYAKGEIRVATNPIVAKAIRLGSDGAAIVIPNSAAAKARGSSYDFRRECKVIIVVK